MSLVSFGAGGWEYPEREIAGGLDDYHAGRGEAPGRWVGSGAAAIGLAGRVDREQLGRLFEEARHPRTGEPLGRAHQNFSDRQARCGFGLTFSAPKSVSTLWAVGGPGVAAEVRAAHAAAVEAALGYLERHAAFSRKGKGGVLQVDTDGLVAAAYVHRTSRAQDPQLHTHVLVANRVRCVDGVWRALDARELYGCQKAAGGLYQAALRVELCRRLGVSWTPVDANGQAEIVGVPARLCEHFSTRRRQVEAAGAHRVTTLEGELGRSLTGDERAREYQTATYATRPAKDHTAVADDTLVSRWETEAAGEGLAAHRWLPEVVGRAAGRLVVDGDDIETIAAEVVGALTEGRSTWSRAHVTLQVAARLDPQTTVDAGVVVRVETLVDAALACPEVVRLALAPGAQVPVSLARADGKATMERHGAGRYTTREILALEARVVDAVSWGRDAGVGLVAASTVAAVLADAGLSDDQVRVVARLTTSGAGIECVVGPAGAGKSLTMRAAGAAWELSGYPVRGLAVSAVAAGVLAAQAGMMRADTFAKFLVEHARGDPASPHRLRAGEIVVLDEASMVATRDLARLVNLVAQVKGKLVLVGDHRQLGAVEAGGLFRLLVTDTAAAELEGIHRFAAGWEAAASRRLRDRDPTVIDTYAEHGRIVGGTRDDMIDAAFAAWLDARQTGESVVVVAPDHATVEALAARARDVLVAAGQVEAGGVDASGQVVGVGDEIVTCENDRRLLTSRGLWVRNGDRWRITALSGGGGLVVEHLDGRGRAVLPPDYVAEHVRLAYALTVHKTQGLTVDRCVLVVDDRTAAEHAYVGLTRGRLDNRACVVCEPAEWGGPTPDARHVLSAALARTIGEVSATETLRDALTSAESLAVLYPAWLEARHQIDTHAGPDRHAQLDALSKHTQELRRRLRYLPVARRNVEHARAELTRATRSLDAAKSEVAIRNQPRSWWRRPEPAQPTRTAEDVAVRQRWVDDTRAELTRTEDILRRVEADEPKLGDLDAKAVRLAAAVWERQAWLDTHASEGAWEADLRQRIASRTRELGETAADDWPKYLIWLIGPVPNLDRAAHRDRWERLASRIEAYRERWGVHPTHVAVEPDGRGEQHRHWQRVMFAIDDARRRPEEPEVPSRSADPTVQAPIAASHQPDIGL